MKKSSSAANPTSSESRADARMRDHELKVITDRITLAEKHFAMLHKDILVYCTSLESLQDKGVKLSTSMEAYAEEEFPSVRGSMQAMAENIATAQDYLGSKVEFLHSRVAQPLSLYTTNCKLARDYLKGTTTARDKELVKLKALDKVKAKDPNNKSKISQLEQELHKTAVDAGRSRQTMVEQMVTFEKKKIDDLKNIFGSYFQGQMMFHAKALEIYTQAFKNLMAIDEEQDLEAFETALHPPSMPTRLDVVKYGSHTSLQRFGSQGSLGGSQLSLNRTTQSLQSQGTLGDTMGSEY